MISRKSKIFSAAAAVTALVLTAAVARTVHTHAAGPLATTGQAVSAQAGNGQPVGAASGAVAPSSPHASFACALPTFADCQKIETWLPE
jgi:hypothetical protein